MKKIDFGFVILHYQAIEMTIKCINTLFNTFDMNNNFVVIVDNASPNGSGIMLQNLYIDNKQIKVILSKTNDGFAKGNNRGFFYLKQNFYLNFMIVMNNDILIMENNFFVKIKEIYKRTHFDILGPDIFNPNLNYHQNPNGFKILDEKQLEMLLAKYKKRLYFYKLYILKMFICGVKNKILKTHNSICISKYDFSKEYLNPILHGSCYIFSNDFVQQREYAFYPETFMFLEEDILAYQCALCNFKTVYTPEIQVIHLEDVSTYAVFKSSTKKNKWKYTETINSILTFLTLIRQDKTRQNSNFYIACQYYSCDYTLILEVAA